MLDLGHDVYDRLTTVENETTGATIQYGYDSAGRRISATDGSHQRKFLVTPVMGSGLESTDLMTDGAGNLISNYIYAGGSSPFMRLDANGSPVYYLTDGMGSVIGLADGAGTSAAKFGYDAFGNVRFSQGMGAGVAGGDFRFQGQWLESATGIYHFRARDYDARTGTFLSRDPVAPTEQDPEALNPYQAMYNNPYVYSDPTGMFTLMDVNASQTIQNVLQQQGYNAVRRELLDQARGTVTNILMSTMQNLLMTLVPGSEFTDAIDDVLGDSKAAKRGGRTWERLLTDSICDVILGSYQNYTRNLWIQPGVATTGRPTFDGFNCGGYTYTLRNKVISTRGLGVSGPRPDFIIKEGGPASTDFGNPPPNNGSKAYLIGDVKSSWNAVEGGLGGNQWKAITGYAKYSNNHQYIPAGLYVTAIGGNEAMHQRVVRRGLTEGVYTYLLTLFPFIRR